MKSICLKQWQVEALEEDRLHTIIIPANPQPEPCEDKFWLPNGSYPFKDGELIFIRERWQTLALFTDYETGTVDDYKVIDPKKAKSILNSETILFNKSVCITYATEWEEAIEDRGFPWRSSATMPEWASRFILKIDRPLLIGALQLMTEEMARDTGIERLATGCIVPYSNPIKRIELTHLDWFKDRWDLDHKAGLKWADNPFCWIIKVRKVEKR